MFFKSCNCNSSIATRVGFAVRGAHYLSNSCAHFRLDYILSQFNIGLDHEE